MKKLICTIIFGICAFSLCAQDDQQLSQYVFNQVLINPAAVGGSGMMEASVLQRSQFMGFKGAPTIWSLGVSSPFGLFNAEHGGALNISNDKVGSFDKMTFKLSYAYWHRFSNEGKLGIGISLGGISYRVDPSSDWSSSGAADPSIPTSKEASSVGFDLGFGLYYKQKNYFVSLSCLHLNQPKTLKLETGDKALQVKRTFYLSGGYEWQTSNENIVVYPSALMSFVTLKKPQFGFGGNVFYQGRYWGGLSYRILDALGITAGINFDDVFKVGVAYEYPLSNFFGNTGGNLEVFLTYAFEVKIKKKEKKYKSLRFL